MMATGANDVMVVEPTSQSVDERERLIPWLPERVVISVDRDAGQVEIDWGADY